MNEYGVYILVSYLVTATCLTGITFASIKRYITTKRRLHMLKSPDEA